MQETVSILLVLKNFLQESLKPMLKIKHKIRFYITNILLTSVAWPHMTML